MAEPKPLDRQRIYKHVIDNFDSDLPGLIKWFDELPDDQLVRILAELKGIQEFKSDDCDVPIFPILSRFALIGIGATLKAKTDG